MLVGNPGRESGSVSGGRHRPSRLRPGALLGQGLIDATNLVIARPALAYATVFGIQALVFVLAARLALGVFQARDHRSAGSAIALTQVG